MFVALQRNSHVGGGHSSCTFDQEKATKMKFVHGFTFFFVTVLLLKFFFFQSIFARFMVYGIKIMNKPYKYLFKCFFNVQIFFSKKIRTTIVATNV